MPPLGSSGTTEQLLQWGFEKPHVFCIVRVPSVFNRVVCMERVIRYRLECMERVIRFVVCMERVIVSSAWSGSSAFNTVVCRVHVLFFKSCVQLLGWPFFQK
jgi:hypothetical protein